MAHIIGSKCIETKDGICMEVCPIEDCIQEGETQMFINPETCIDCGMCLEECPVLAVFEDEDEAIEEGERDAVIANYKFFKMDFEG